MVRIKFSFLIVPVMLLLGCSMTFTGKEFVIARIDKPVSGAGAAVTGTPFAGQPAAAPPAPMRPQPAIVPLEMVTRPKAAVESPKASASAPVPTLPVQPPAPFPFPPAPSLVNSNGVVELGTRLELFVDDFMIETLSGGAKQVVHQPEPREVVLVTDKPWEGNACNYYSVFQEGDHYRMYYRAMNCKTPESEGELRGMACATSTDGIQWKRRSVGRVKFNNDLSNNLIDLSYPASGDSAVMKNDDPRHPQGARYLATTWTYMGLGMKTSANGFDWSVGDPGILPMKGTFDSQNTLFWDAYDKLYRCYYRVYNGVGRSVRTAVSHDLKHWSEAVDLEYPGAPDEQVYTSAILRYPRAPHLLVGFPTILLNGQGQVAPEFMSSRDGVTFHRWAEKIIPVTAPKDRDGNRSNYMAWGFLALPGNPDEYSFYATEAYLLGQEPTRLRRFTYRLDGFVSVSSATESGEVLTRALTFEGHEMVINASTQPEGNVHAEIQMEGQTVAESESFTGNSTGQVLRWKSDADLGALAGKTVQVRFVLQNADLYSFRFR